MGKISLSDGESIAVYEVELSDNVDIVRNRRGIRDMLTTDWRNAGHAGAFMFCYRKHESILRFSYVSETWGFNKQGDYEKISTNTKRYTYLLGECRGCRTAIEQFSELKDSKQTLSDITKAFSVEALTKQFYKELFAWYLWAVDPSSNISFPNNTSIEDDDKDCIEIKIIRLITRIIFVWFIKQKGLVPNKIFEPNYLKTILKDFDPESCKFGNFYNAILQNLFFATLNRAIEDEEGNKREFAKSSKKDIKTLYRYAELFKISEEEVVQLFAEVPFLNGGLFECLDKTVTLDGVDKAFNLDGFSRNDKTFSDGRYRNRAIIPNIFFFDQEKGLISILNRYNFTIEENTPEEQQVALDPELLGKVFENLLGAYNPETRETVRKQSGSFYTPREIVNYMVDQSLLAYLDNTPIAKSLMDDDFTYDKQFENEYRAIYDSLKSIKILDPACGSGAFPMGILNRMMDIFQKIAPNENPYDLKLAIIENCIYGSDIQSIAVQISKLRFFISLICNCERDASKPNFGIPTLPNLETKFVAANSLISKKKKPVQRQLFENPEIDITKEALSDVRHEHFRAKSASIKRRLREKDEELRDKLAKLIADEDYFAPEDALQLASWNPYDQNAVSPFFDPEWMFGVSDGFDVVIGNPPYIQLQSATGRKIKDKKGKIIDEKLGDLYINCDFETFARTGDIYCLFYERGCQLLKPNGHLCYITSNKWMRAGYGEKLREFFIENNPHTLIDLGPNVFETATVDTNILIIEKKPYTHSTISCSMKSRTENMSDFIRQNSILQNFTKNSWCILNPIEQSIKAKIEKIGVPLKDWDIKIYRGILTGCNEAFIIDGATKDALIAQDPKSAEIIRPILRGRDIKRYSYDFADKWLITTFPSKHYNIDDYPAIKNYLLSFGKEKLEQSGKKDIGGIKGNNARKKTNNKWFETQDTIAYWDDFSKQKIVYPETTQKAAFALDYNCMYIDKTCFMLISEKAKYLYATLNSKLFEYAYRRIFSSIELGSSAYQYNKHALINLPIKKVSPNLEKLFNKLVDNLLNTKDSNDREVITEEIELNLCKIYEISKEEQIFIKSI